MSRRRRKRGKNRRQQQRQHQQQESQLTEDDGTPKKRLTKKQRRQLKQQRLRDAVHGQLENLPSGSKTPQTMEDFVVKKTSEQAKAKKKARKDARTIRPSVPIELIFVSTCKSVCDVTPC